MSSQNSSWSKVCVCPTYTIQFSSNYPREVLIPVSDTGMRPNGPKLILHLALNTLSSTTSLLYALCLNQSSSGESGPSERRGAVEILGKE